jgi:hypothetical protein
MEDHDMTVTLDRALAAADAGVVVDNDANRYALKSQLSRIVAGNATDIKSSSSTHVVRFGRPRS